MTPIFFPASCEILEIPWSFLPITVAYSTLSMETIAAIVSIDKVEYATVIGRKDHGISNISQLAGKKIGVIRGTAIDFYLGLFLTLHGLRVKDVTLVDMASNNAMV